MNTNIRHHGKLYHVQTEDSGLEHPHIITHLFADGAIVATRKTSYGEHRASPNLGDIVKKMMKESHREMLIALRDGKFDGSGGHPHVEVDIPIEIDAAGPMEPAAGVRPGSRPLMPAAQTPVPPRPRGKSGQVARPPSTRMARAATPDVPRPPPAVLLEPKSTPAETTYKEIRKTPGGPEGDAVPARPIVDVSANRYAGTQPVKKTPTVAPDAPPAPGASIFGKEVVSEKSLDEVILSYLSEDVTEE